jgi:ubiquinone/menaquinone biosynthesis C-methylase UbiE
MKELASNKEWKKWGEIDPLFGVASWQDKGLGGSAPWTDQEFYQLGESDWDDFAGHWEMYGVGRESCLEIGCGAGRITMQLAQYFKHVHAIDVSEKMIEYARRNISSSSVTFHLSNGVDIPLADQSVLSVFSTHVFQHFDSLSVADSYFAEIARTLKPGGTLMIHLPVYGWPSKSIALRVNYAALKMIGDIRARGRRLLMQFGFARPFMRGLSYPIEYLYNVLPSHGFEDVELAVFAAMSNNGLHSFVFARKRH